MIKLFNNLKQQLDKDNKTLSKTKIKTAQEMANVVRNVTFQPRSINDMYKIADAVISKKTAHVNLSKFNEKDIATFKHFMAGILYAIGGDQDEVVSKQFIFSATKIEVDDKG